MCVQVENVFVYNPGQADKAKIAKRKFEVRNIGVLTNYVFLSKIDLMPRLKKETF